MLRIFIFDTLVDLGLRPWDSLVWRRDRDLANPFTYYRITLVNTWIALDLPCSGILLCCCVLSACASFLIGILTIGKKYLKVA